MSQQPPILDSQPVTDAQKRLLTFFDDVERQQVDFLQEAGKRIIEVTTGLLGVLYAVTAFGDKFPPPYLKDNPLAKGAAILALVLYLLAMALALRAVQPRDYQRYRNNLSKMQEVFDQIVQSKARALQGAGICFLLGSVSLALLIISVILAA